VFPLIVTSLFVIFFDEICGMAMNFVFCFARVTLAKIANTPLDKSAALVLFIINSMYFALASAKSGSPARNFAGAGFGRISEKMPDSEFARIEIRYSPNH